MNREYNPSASADKRYEKGGRFRVFTHEGSFFIFFLDQLFSSTIVFIFYWSASTKKPQILLALP